MTTQTQTFCVCRYDSDDHNRDGKWYVFAKSVKRENLARTLGKLYCKAYGNSSILVTDNDTGEDLDGSEWPPIEDCLIASEPKYPRLAQTSGRHLS